MANIFFHEMKRMDSLTKEFARQKTKLGNVFKAKANRNQNVKPMLDKD